MTNRSTLCCFVDTNTLIRFTTFDEVDWCQALGADAVELILAPIVIAELDKHKHDHRNEWRAERAQMILRKLRKLLEAPKEKQPVEVRRSVTLSALDHEPRIDWNAHGLDPSTSDDRLIASILEYQEIEPERQLVLVTNDFGPQRKASVRSIAVIDAEDVATRLHVPSALP